MLLNNVFQFNEQFLHDEWCEKVLPHALMVHRRIWWVALTRIESHTDYFLQSLNHIINLLSLYFSNLNCIWVYWYVYLCVSSSATAISFCFLFTFCLTSFDCSLYLFIGRSRSSLRRIIYYHKSWSFEGFFFSLQCYNSSIPPSLAIPFWKT